MFYVQQGSELISFKPPASTCHPKQVAELMKRHREKDNFQHPKPNPLRKSDNRLTDPKPDRLLKTDEELSGPKSQSFIETEENVKHPVPKMKGAGTEEIIPPMSYFMVSY